MTSATFLFHASHVHSLVGDLFTAGLPVRPRVCNGRIEASPGRPDQLEQDIDSGRLGPDMCGAPHQNRFAIGSARPGPDYATDEFGAIGAV